MKNGDMIGGIMAPHGGSRDHAAGSRYPDPVARDRSRELRAAILVWTAVLASLAVLAFNG
jgi:hypothetical protein